MKSSDLRSNQVRSLIYIFAIVSALGFIIPITSHFTDTTFWEDNIGVAKNGSIGLGVIMVATTGGIGMAFVMRRKSSFMMYQHYYCKKTGEKMYEDDEHEKIFCPTHGEQKQEYWASDERHYEFLSDEELVQKKLAQKIGKKYHESQDTARQSENSIHSRLNSYKTQSVLDQMESAGHTHGLSGSRSGEIKPSKKDLEIKIETLSEKLANLDKQLSRKRTQKNDDDDDDNFLLGMGLGLGL